MQTAGNILVGHFNRRVQSQGGWGPTHPLTTGVFHQDTVQHGKSRPLDFGTLSVSAFFNSVALLSCSNCVDNYYKNKCTFEAYELSEDSDLDII